VCGTVAAQALNFSSGVALPVQNFSRRRAAHRTPFVMVAFQPDFKQVS